MNRLGKEKSPYLLQHAENPVDWYPWGEEAFAKAKAEDKPILLSIGYSTCHWCHVMERESFESAETAKLMNENLVCIKLDREERPDIDAVYMNAVTALTGQGGWPLNVFLTHELKPFYGGTYFPPKQAFNRPSWPQLVAGIGKAWKEKDARAHLHADSEKLAEAVKELAQGLGAASELKSEWIQAGVDAFKSAFDPDLGGFSPAPKFPMPVNQRFLFEAGDKQAKDMALFSLRAMALGGIHDHLGGGFARYSTDERWHVPHFEKMLYDNAQLAQNYLEAFQLSNDAFFADTARGIFTYVLRDLKAPGGAFYSAEDADSAIPGQAHKVEGAFYAFTKEEIFNTLGPDAGDRFCMAFGCELSGNVDFDPHGDFKGKNVLFLKEPVGFHEERGKLRALREKRPRPSRDEKILTSWNGLMIQALAMGYQVLGDEAYLKAAETAADFILKELFDKKLYRRWAGGERAVPANADDYAQLIAALLDLYECAGEARWLDKALQLQSQLRQDFFDPESGALWLTRQGEDPHLIARVEESQDNVEPSAASTFVRNCLKLWLLSGDNKFRTDAELSLKRLGTLMQKHPRASAGALSALNLFLKPSLHLVVVGDAQSEIARRLRAAHAPGRALLHLKAGEKSDLEFAKGFEMKSGKPTAYVCMDQACKLPTVDVEEALKALIH